MVAKEAREAVVQFCGAVATSAQEFTKSGNRTSWHNDGSNGNLTIRYKMGRLIDDKGKDLK